MPKYLKLLMIFNSLCLTLSTMEAAAQTMYRCGSSYQDKPCANGQTSVVVGTQKSAARDQSERVSQIDPACKAKGEEAKKIIWMREGGAQKNDLLAKSNSVEQSQLITEIYAVRGNSNEIRANIEKNCMEQKEVSKRIGALPDAATLQALVAAQQAAQNTEKSNLGQVDTKKLGRDQSMEDVGTPAVKKRLSCPSLKNQLEIVNANLRAGGDVQSRQTLQQQKRDFEKEVAQACGQ
nr:hypothetical protein [uncultured Undibacterium sp.]